LAWQLKNRVNICKSTLIVYQITIPIRLCDFPIFIYSLLVFLTQIVKYQRQPSLQHLLIKVILERLYLDFI
jgi:hypothetical protein